MQHVIGGDVGGTNLRFALIDRQGKILNKAEAKTPEKKEDILGKILELIGKVHRKPYVISIGVGGIVNHSKGEVVFTPNFDFSSVTLSKSVQEKFKFPCMVENDANTAAWGEKIYGAAKGAKNFVCVTLGTGIGGGIVVNGKIYHGSFGAAGEIGHITIGYAKDVKAFGINADYENMASGSALGRLARAEIKKGSKSAILGLAKGKTDKISGTMVTAAARQGDETAIKLLQKLSELIGMGLANIVNVLDPELIVLTGGLSGAGPLLLPDIKKSLYRRMFAPDYRKPEVITGKLGPDAGIIGAAALAFYPYG